jgi:hypothetical protein
MFDLDNLLEQYLKNIEPDNRPLFEYIKAYQFVVDQFGRGFSCDLYLDQMIFPCI